MNDSGQTVAAEIYPWLDGHWSFFTHCLEVDRLAHALLVEGPAGCGKTALANAMVARLLCTENKLYACGCCKSCELLAGGAHPEYFEATFEINPKTGKLRTVIAVEQVRRMIAALQLTNSISSRKVACIFPADSMHWSAANAILKSLEEPTGDTVLILVTDSPGKLPVTIRSRCQAIHVSQPDGEVVLDWLEHGSNKPLEELHAALQAAGGSPLRAMQYLDSPELDGYTRVRDGLATLLVRPASVSKVSAQLGDLNPVELWRWLSMCTGDALKSSMTGSPLDWLAPNRRLKDKTLLQLQQQADFNRRLSATPIRGDLLLQDWLIRWAEQGI